MVEMRPENRAREANVGMASSFIFWGVLCERGIDPHGVVYIAFGFVVPEIERMDVRDDTLCEKQLGSY
jgi:hypothetical protein